MNKKMMILSIILILCFINACSQKEKTLEAEKEEVELYAKEFVEESENWEITLRLKELPVDELYMEESTFTFKRLNGVDDSIGLNYEMIYGDPIKYTVTLLEKGILGQGEDELKFTEVQKRLIEEVCFNQFTLKIIWNHGAEEAQEDSFIFMDDQNPQCDHIVPIATKGDVK